MHCPQRGALGADVTPAPDVVAVGSDGGHLTVFDMDLKPTHRLTQWAGVEVEAVLADSRELVNIMAHRRVPRFRLL
ncbi:hypothetical protein GCM10009645_14250 [Mycolicibacterium poriferae]|uniref:Uncharacterized protein n=1 Tax=Mycolicibacterium poriferae TaxID=39694 RepID=A0A6N4VFX6_9MYCO|nr:hypothetical protein MPOR_35630 [Mycolicibacterium poriferae]